MSSSTVEVEDIGVGRSRAHISKRVCSVLLSSISAFVFGRGLSKLARCLHPVNSDTQCVATTLVNASTGATEKRGSTHSQAHTPVTITMNRDTACERIGKFDNMAHLKALVLLDPLQLPAREILKRNLAKSRCR